MRKSNAIRPRENEVLEATREVGAGERADGTLGTPLLQWACMPDSPFPFLFGQRSREDGDGSADPDGWGMTGPSIFKALFPRYK